VPVPAPLRKVDLIRAGRVSRAAVIPLEPIPRRRRLEGDDPGTLEVRGYWGKLPECVILKPYPYMILYLHTPQG